MFNTVLLFFTIGALINVAVFFLIEAFGNRREHTWAAAASQAIGLIVVLTPAKAFVMTTAGAMASAAASWVWALNLFLVWGAGVGLSLWGLKTWRP